MTYPQKLRHRNELYPSEENLLKELESLNVSEWKSFLDALFRGAPEAIRCVSPNLGDDPADSASARLSSLGQHTQSLVRQALESLIEDYRRKQDDIPLLRKTLQFAALSPEGVDGQKLLDLALDEHYRVDLRIDAARALADHPERAPDPFLDLDPTEHPHLAAPLVATLTERRGPLEALTLLQKFRPEPQEEEPGFLESSARRALGKLQHSDAGLTGLRTLYYKTASSSWFRNFIDRLIELPELDKARHLLKKDTPLLSRLPLLASMGIGPPGLPLLASMGIGPLNAPPVQRRPTDEDIPDFKHGFEFLNRDILNGDDYREDVQAYVFRDVGCIYGKWITTHPAFPSYDHKTTEDIRHYVRLALKASQENAKAREYLCGPYLLRAACERRLGDDARVPSPNEVCSALSRLTKGNLVAHANNLANAIKSLEIGRKLRIGRSEFHEDRLFTALLTLLLDESEVPVPLPKLVDCHWSNFAIGGEGLEEADIVFMFENDAKQRDVPCSNSLYRFRGHYILVRREAFQKIADGHGGDPEAERSAQALLKQGILERETESTFDQARQRLRVALACGVPTTLGTGEEILYEGLTRHLARFCQEEKIGTVKNGQKLPKSHAEAFEKFLSNNLDQPWFVGGAIYARLLNKWWAPYEAGRYVVPLVRPQDLDLLFKNHWHVSNVVALNPRLRKLGVQDKLFNELQCSLFSVCQSVSQTLWGLLERHKRREREPDSEDQTVLAFAYDALLPKREEEAGPARQSFVAEEEDVVHLLQKDNDFSAPKPRDSGAAKPRDSGAAKPRAISAAKPRAA